MEITINLKYETIMDYGCTYMKAEGYVILTYRQQWFKYLIF